jgi:hypothetical protein
LNEKTHTPFLDDFGFVIINLTQFNKQEHELKSNFEKWLYLLKNLDKLKDIPLKLQQHLFVKLFNLAEYGALSKKEQKAYMESLKKYNDWENVLEFAQKKGYKKAVLKYEELLKEEKKRAEEKEKLLNEEKKRAEEEKIETIKILLSMGMSLENVMKATHTDKDFLKKHNLIS